MVIVPYQVLETMKWWRDKQYQKLILPPNPQAVDASHLLKDMGQILQQKKNDLSEAEKAQKYDETLFKLQNSLEKKKKKKHLQYYPQPILLKRQTRIKHRQHLLSCMIKSYKVYPKPCKEKQSYFWV